MSPWMFTQYAVLWLGFLLEGTAVYYILRRRFWQQMPAFSTYCLFSAPRTLAVFLSNTYASVTFAYYFYWATELISAALAMWVIFELFLTVMQPYEGIRALSRILFRWIVVGLVVLAFSFGIFSYRNSQWKYIADILALEEGIHIIQVGLILFLFLFATTLALSWRHRAFGIALGFGITALGNLVAYTMLSTAGRAAVPVYDLLGPASYVCATMIWVYYLASPVPARAQVARAPLSGLDGWDRAITQVLKR